MFPALNGRGGREPWNSCHLSLNRSQKVDFDHQPERKFAHPKKKWFHMHPFPLFFWCANVSVSSM